MMCLVLLMACTTAMGKKKMKAVKSLEHRFERVDENMTEMPEQEEAIFFKLGDENSVLTVSAKLSGEYGGNDVFIGVPSIIGRNGVKEVLELSLTDEERQKFDKSRQVLKESFEGLKL